MMTGWLSIGAGRPLRVQGASRSCATPESREVDVAGCERTERRFRCSFPFGGAQGEAGTHDRGRWQEAAGGGGAVVVVVISHSLISTLG